MNFIKEILTISAMIFGNLFCLCISCSILPIFIILDISFFRETINNYILQHVSTIKLKLKKSTFSRYKTRQRKETKERKIASTTHTFTVPSYKFYPSPLKSTMMVIRGKPTRVSLCRCFTTHAQEGKKGRKNF